MTERDLDDLIHRYQNGLAKPDEINFLNELQQLNLTDNEFESVDDQPEMDQIRHRVWKSLMKDVDNKPYWFIVVKNSFQQHAHLWAAFVLVLLGLSTVHFFLSSTKEHDYYTYAQNTSIHADQPVRLPDGSKIILKSASTIELHQQFNRSDRRVKLNGSAYFDVRRDTNKPFIIQAGQLVTKVLGTSFSILNSEASRDIEVNVYTGKVSVQAEPSADKRESPELLLTPNLKAVFNKDSKTLRESLGDKLTVIPSENSADLLTFNYHEETLRKVLNQLENAYGIDIILLNEADGSRLLTGDLRNLTLYQKLNLICSATNLRYEIKGSKIILKETP